MTTLAKTLVYISVGGLIIVGLWLRLWQLGTVPAAFYHDELDYVITGESILRWGTDLSGTWKPWQLKPLQTINFTAELPAVFHAVTQLIFGSSPGAARLTNAIWGLATVVMAGILGAKLSGKKQVGWWTAALMLVNPWHVHISRLGYEATISLFFQILLILGLFHILPLELTNRDKKIIWPWLLVTLAAMFGGYYTYHGAKFTIPILVISYLIWYGIKSIKNRKKIRLEYWIVSGFLLILVGHSLWMNHLGLFGYRNSADLYLWGSTKIETKTQVIDRIPFLPNTILNNKLIVLAREVIKRYWFVFDPNRLLFTGYEGTHQFSLIVNGYFGIVELIGIILFWRIHQKNAYSTYLLILMLISPVATIMAGYQAILRSALTYAVILILSGWGLGLFLEKFRLKSVIPILILFITGTSVWFGFGYFSRYPLVSSENHMLADRILARYLRPIDRPITVVVDKDTYITARNIVYYNQLLGTMTGAERRQFAFPFPATIKVDNATVTTECPDDLSDELLVVHPNKWQSCGLNEEYKQMSSKPQITVLPSPQDNGSYYFIWHNVVCGDAGRQFIHLQKISELNLERLSDEQFCKTWIRYEQ